MTEGLRDGIVDKFIGVNDGSTDAGPDILRRQGIGESLPSRRGKS
jgi:hypothetical protein